jgi:hypothetical protein
MASVKRIAGMGDSYVAAAAIEENVDRVAHKHSDLVEFQFAGEVGDDLAAIGEDNPIFHIREFFGYLAPGGGLVHRLFEEFGVLVNRTVTWTLLNTQFRPRPYVRQKVGHSRVWISRTTLFGSWFTALRASAAPDMGGAVLASATVFDHKRCRSNVIFCA